DAGLAGFVTGDSPDPEAVDALGGQRQRDLAEQRSEEPATAMLHQSHAVPDVSLLRFGHDRMLELADPLGALRNPAIGDDSIPRPGRKAPCAPLVAGIDQVSVMAHGDLHCRAGADRRLFEADGQPGLDPGTALRWLQ